MIDIAWMGGAILLLIGLAYLFIGIGEIIERRRAAKIAADVGVHPATLDECGVCGLPITGPKCTIAKVSDGPEGGGGSSATFHGEHCPCDWPEHEHGTSTVRVGSDL